jgi:hypothetical protein
MTSKTKAHLIACALLAALAAGTTTAFAQDSTASSVTLSPVFEQRVLPATPPVVAATRAGTPATTRSAPADS